MAWDGFVGGPETRIIVHGDSVREFAVVHYRTLKSRGCKRRVVARVEWRTGRRREHTRSVVTFLGRDRYSRQDLFERLYAARGHAENVFKGHQMDLFGDRTSLHMMRANQFRIYVSVFAGIIGLILRDVGLAGTAMAKTSMGTIRTRLLKLVLFLGNISVAGRPDFPVSFITDP